MRLALVIALAGLAAACAREPEPAPVVVAPPVTAEPVFTGKI